MQYTAKHRYARSSPQKLRLVANAIRQKNVLTALNALTHIHKKSARLIKKVLYSAMSNAKNRCDSFHDRFKISSIYIDPGPHCKRTTLRAKGKSDRILKKTSHITVTISG